MLRRLSLLAALMALVVMLVPGVATAQEDTDDPSIAEIVATNGQYKQLLRAVRAAGLLDAVVGLDGVTVFAPNNRAFSRTLKDLGLTPSQLWAQPALLSQIILYHVVPAELYSSDVVGFVGNIPTLQGETIAVNGNNLTLNGNVHLDTRKLDIQASNGVIHGIDRVLLPPSITGG
jgi:uncharacterized surface protein with fasciclin (FAS1) repeats